MTSGRDLINNNAQSAECAFYEGGTALAEAVAIGSLLTGQFWGSIAASAGGLAFQHAAELAGCNYNPDPPTGPGGPPTGVDGCKKIKNGVGALYSSIDDFPMGGGAGNGIVEIVSYEPNPATGDYADGTWWTVGYPDGTTGIVAASGERARRAYIFFGDPAECEETGTPDGGLPPDAIGTPTTVTDGDCNWTFTPKDSYIDAAGIVRTYYVIEADNDACGGPFAYWSGSGEPTPVAPDPPTPKPTPIPPPEPCPCEPGSGGGDCPEIPPPHQLSAGNYSLTGVCETVSEGSSQPTYDYPTAGGRFEEALASKLDAIASMLQRHLALKTPTCQPEIQPLEGDYRTITFISDENSPEGKRRLSKRFRYRSSSGIGLSGVVEHWRSFTWQAGAVIVAHTGSALGAPKVWAASAEEGKRVIRHAAGEAGLDADQTGRWIISGSSDPRYGMPGTMRVNTKGGYYWITSRLGPDQRPLVQSI